MKNVTVYQRVKDLNLRYDQPSMTRAGREIKTLWVSYGGKKLPHVVQFEKENKRKVKVYAYPEYFWVKMDEILIKHLKPKRKRKLVRRQMQHELVSRGRF